MDNYRFSSDDDEAGRDSYMDDAQTELIARFARKVSLARMETAPPPRDARAGHIAQLQQSLPPAWRGPTELLPYDRIEGARMQYELRLVGRSHVEVERRAGTGGKETVVVRMPATTTLFQLAQVIDERHLRHVRPLDHGVLGRKWSFALARLDPLEGAAGHFGSPFGSQFVSPFGSRRSSVEGVSNTYRFFGPEPSFASQSRFPPQTRESATELFRLGLQAGEVAEFVYDVDALGGPAEHVRINVRAVICTDPEEDEGAWAVGAPGMCGAEVHRRQQAQREPPLRNSTAPSSREGSPVQPFLLMPISPQSRLPATRSPPPPRISSPVRAHGAEASNGAAAPDDRALTPLSGNAAAHVEAGNEVRMIGGGGGDGEESRRNRRGKNAPSRQRHSARRAAAFRLKEAEQCGSPSPQHPPSAKMRFH